MSIKINRVEEGHQTFIFNMNSVFNLSKAKNIYLCTPEETFSQHLLCIQYMYCDYYITCRLLSNQNQYIEEEQTTQWPKEEEQTTQWPKEEEQTTQWPKEEEQTTQWPKEEEQTTQ